MKKIGLLMEEMGFNSQATASSKAAFVKYLVKQAYNVEVEIPEIYKAESVGSLENLMKKSEPEQLSFNLESNFKKAE